MRHAKALVSRVGAWVVRSRFFPWTLGIVLHGYLVVIAVVGFFALISAIDGARISTLSVDGNNVVSTEEIIAAVEGVLSQPFAFVVGRDVPLWTPQKEIATAVYALDPHIHAVELDGRLSRTLSVVVSEEVPAMLWCGTDVPDVFSDTAPCWFANERGTIYGEAPDYLDAPYLKFFTTPAPVFFDQYPRAHEYPLGYAIADQTTMDRLQSFAEALPERGYRVVAVGITSDADVVLFTDEGVRFLFSLSRDIIADMRRFEALRAALRQKGESEVLSSVDLRFDSKIYYR